MSPSCTIKAKQQPLDQHKTKSKYHKNKSRQSMATEKNEHVYIELDIKCSCPQSKLNNCSSIQFSRRYLQCQSSMPVAILRSYIQQILPHSSMTQVSLFDPNDQLLNDSQLLRSLTTSTSSSTHHIPIRFTLLNTITSLSHCTCSSLSKQSTTTTSSSSNVSIIQRESLDEALSTCPLIPPRISTSPPSQFANPNSISVSIVNLLTPPSSSSSSSCHSSYPIEPNQSIIDEITSTFGEICPPLPSRKKRSSKKSMTSSNMPLDLSLKKRPLPSSFDIYSSQAKWIKT